jgi:hypothetical protein
VHAMTIISVLFFVFIVVPILYWGVRLAWWLTRVAYISALILIHLAGRAWRGEWTRTDWATRELLDY